MKNQIYDPDRDSETGLVQGDPEPLDDGPAKNYFCADCGKRIEPAETPSHECKQQRIANRAAALRGRNAARRKARR